MNLGRATRAALAIGLWAAASSGPARADEAWGTGSAAELVRQGREHAKSGDDELAARRFVDAIQLDPTFAPAYLDLASLRERAGDLREAERTYDVVIRLVPDFAPAFRERARLLHRLGDSSRELADLEEAARLSDAPEILRDLAERHVADRSWPAALATWRKVLAMSESKGDEPLERQARVQIRALVILCGELDPVAGGIDSRNWIRRAEAIVARRRGM